MSSKQTTTLSMAVGATLAATLAAAPVQADVNPFAMSLLSSGYMVADGKTGEAKCGANKSVVEAKCGAEKAAPMPVAKPIQEAKCGEAKCASNKK